MDLITSLLDGLDNLSGLVPPLDRFMGSVSGWLRFFIILGPLVLLGLGLWYLLAPPKEANHRAGFRTYYGMGSVEAWQYTQRLAGRIFTVLGGVLTLVMGIICLVLGSKDAMATAQTAVICLLLQVVLTLAAHLTVTLSAAAHYDRSGNPKP